MHHYLNERNIMYPSCCFAQQEAPSQRQEEKCPHVCCVEVLYYRWTNTHSPDVCSQGRRVRLHWIGTIFHQITLVRIPAVGLDQKHSSLAGEIIFSLTFSTSFLLFVQLLILQCDTATLKVFKNLTKLYFDSDKQKIMSCSWKGAIQYWKVKRQTLPLADLPSVLILHVFVFEFLFCTEKMIYL